MVRLKVLPADTDVKVNDLLESVKSRLPAQMDIVNIKEEPIAFGIIAVIIDVKMEEKEGAMETLELAVSSSAAVSNLEILGISRSTATLH